MKPMILTVPARREWVLVMRMTAAGVGAMYDLPVDVLDDLRTAIDESCELLLHQDYCAQALTMKVEMREDGLHVDVAAEKCEPKSTSETVDPDIARLIIGTLVREVDLSQDENGVHEVRMLMPASVKTK